MIKQVELDAEEFQEALKIHVFLSFLLIAITRLHSFRERNC